LQARKLIASQALTVCLGTALLKDEELARYLEYSKLSAVVTMILTWLKTGVDRPKIILFQVWFHHKIKIILKNFRVFQCFVVT